MDMVVPAHPLAYTTVCCQTSVTAQHGNITEKQPMAKLRPAFNFETAMTPEPAPETPTPPTLEAKTRRYPTRENRRGVTFYVPPTAWEQLRMIAIRERSSTQELMVEALDMLFTNRGYPRVARGVTTEREQS
jgi:hypothetical protein